MAGKKAFLFDTNFIVSMKKMDDVVDNLKSDYVVYITQVSIDERIAQHLRELKQKYDALLKAGQQAEAFAQITYKKSFEEMAQVYREWIQDSYEQLFGKNLIPLEKTEESFTKLIERANNKLPPFSAAENASDKGFKDYLLWASILTFFKDHGEQDVEFLSNDKAFLDNADYFIKEFKEQTGKSIVLKPVEYYKDLIKAPQPMPKEDIPEPPINISELRNEVESTIESLTFAIVYNGYGDERWYKTFIATKPFERDHIIAFFDNLDKSLYEHIFESGIRASDLLNFDNNVIDGEREIPTEDLEKARDLFKKVKSRYPEYLEQFYTAAIKILNRNYNGGNYEDDLPF